ncbi:MAG: metal ABC transporter ATP-binding protein [Hyphomonadaceae bacterium]|nr:metal ABC transporter ATP-binding protein [Clostridia bacterium]
MKNACGKCCTKMNGLTVKAGNHLILDNIDLHLHCGEMTVIIGPNGGGKSTLLKALLGMLPFTGSLTFINEKGDRTGAPHIGYVPQSLQFDITCPISVLDLFAACKSKRPVWMGISKHFRQHVMSQLTKVNAQSTIDQQLGMLSGGELQRVLLALAIDPVPDILLLDEPVSGVDLNGLTLFYEVVDDIRKRFDLTIVMVSHDLAVSALYADRMVLLDKKILSIGAPELVLSSAAFVEKFGLHAGKVTGT